MENRHNLTSYSRPLLIIVVSMVVGSNFSKQGGSCLHKGCKFSNWSTLKWVVAKKRRNFESGIISPPAVGSPQSVRGGDFKQKKGCTYFLIGKDATRQWKKNQAEFVIILCWQPLIALILSSKAVMVVSNRNGSNGNNIMWWQQCQWWQ